MSDAKDKERARQGKSAAAIAALEASEQGKSKPKPKPKPKPKEKVGTGRDHSQSNFERLSKGLRADIARAKKKGDGALAAKLEARLKALRETIQ